MNRYESYKNSEIDWVGEIPSYWEMSPLFSIARENRKKNKEKNDNVLSLSYGRIIRRDLSKSFGLLPENFDGYQVVDDGYIIIRSTDLQNDKKSLRVGLVHEYGVITSAYIGLSPSDNVYPDYLFYYLNMCDLKKVFYSLGGGLRQSLRFEEFRRFSIVVPPIEEQKLISRYLDKKTEQIDQLVVKIEKKIVLLKEQRTSLINQYVTKGLDPNVEMKDSGVEWIGKIPKHWDVKKLKYLVSYNTDALPQNTDPDYSFNYIEIGDVDYIEGVNLKEKITFNGSPSRARRVVKSTDVIVSTVRTYLRAIGVVPDIPDVVCSTGFCVLRDQTGLLNQDFLSFSVRSEWFVSSVISNSYGVSYPAINSSELVELKIVLAPLEEQEDIVKILKIKIQNFDNQIQLENKRTNVLKEYRQSLISSVVTGKVRVTEDVI